MTGRDKASSVGGFPLTPKHGHLLREIVYSARLILTRSEDQSDAGYLDNAALRAIVERKVEIIGEDLIRLRDDDRELFGRVDGADRVIGLRNLIAYDDEDYPRERLWRETVALLPALLASVERLLVAAGRPDP